MFTRWINYTIFSWVEMRMALKVAGMEASKPINKTVMATVMKSSQRRLIGYESTTKDPGMATR